jgi:hypothetical protein
MITALQVFNSAAIKMFDVLTLDTPSIHRVLANERAESLCYAFMKTRGMVFKYVKDRYLQRIREYLYHHTERSPVVTLNLSRPQKWLSRGWKDTTGEVSVFGQVWKVMK